MIAVGELRPVLLRPAGGSAFTPSGDFVASLKEFDVHPNGIDVNAGRVMRTGRTARHYPLYPVYQFTPYPEVEAILRLPPAGQLLVWDGEYFYDVTAWHGAYRFEALVVRWLEYEQAAGARASSPQLSFRERRARAEAIHICARELRITLDWKPEAVVSTGGGDDGGEKAEETGSQAESAARADGDGSAAGAGQTVGASGVGGAAP